MKSKLLESELESCAIILANVANAKNFLVAEIIIVPSEFYSVRTNTLSEIKPDFLIAIVKRARESKQAVIFCHTHPFESKKPTFSRIDDQGEKKLATFMHERVPEIDHVALVIGKNYCRARILGTQSEIEVIEAGVFRRKLSSNTSPIESLNESHDRQIRAFGKEGQSAIASLKIGIVGLGGTGSFVSTELAYLGANDFLLIDPDAVEATNLNRLVGCTAKDLGQPKVNVARKNLISINQEANVEIINSDVTYKNVAAKLTECDFIFCCTDSHASRAVINQIAYQYFIPCIDMGVSITTKDGIVSYITGRVQMLSPGLGCLICGNVLDGNTIRREMMNEAQIKADPYFISNTGEPQPAVISLNGTISSLAVTMFLGVVTNIPTNARLQYYDGFKGAIRSVIQTQNPACIVCSKNGALGLGDKLVLPTRPDIIG